jgi:O-methyltransferase
MFLVMAHKVLNKVNMQKPNVLTAKEFDPYFQKVLQLIRGRSVLNPFKCWHLYEFSKRAHKMDGVMAEVGVFRGGGAMTMFMAAPTQRIHLFDTFAGMPDVANPRLDIHKAGQFSNTSLKEVKAYLKDYKTVFHQGIFPDTAKGVKGPFSLVHIDVDLHQSVKTACEFFIDKLVPWGIMLFDDYGARTCPGAKKAVDEFFAKQGKSFVTLDTGQALYIN